MASLSLLDNFHERFVKNRRAHVISNEISNLLPDSADVLDVGCGDGKVAHLIASARPDLTFTGIDTLVREHTHIPVRPFDGTNVPYPENSFDAVMFVDVLHHTNDPMTLLREAFRVTRRFVVLKDHLLEGLAARATLRLMDGVGNRRFGVDLPYHYWKRIQWARAFEQLGMNRTCWNEKLSLYPAWANWMFGRRLHFIAQFERSARD